MNIIQQIDAEQAAAITAKRQLPEFGPGDTVVVAVRVTEGARSRIQNFEGVVIGRAGAGLNENFTRIHIGFSLMPFFKNNWLRERLYD